jgi:hypothetical protein
MTCVCFETRKTEPGSASSQTPTRSSRRFFEGFCIHHGSDGRDTACRES